MLRLVCFIDTVNIALPVFRCLCAERNAARGLKAVVSGLIESRWGFLSSADLRGSYNDKRGD